MTARYEPCPVCTMRAEFCGYGQGLPDDNPECSAGMVLAHECDGWHPIDGNDDDIPHIEWATEHGLITTANQHNFVAPCQRQQDAGSPVPPVEQPSAQEAGKALHTVYTILEEAGISEDQLLSIVNSGDNWGSLVNAVQVLTTLGAVLRTWPKDEQAP